jgi:Uma2 family endonuclease
MTVQAPPYPVCKLTVDGYHRMIQAGLLTEDDPVELLEGWIVPKMPHNPPHDGTVQRANKVINERLPPGWEVRVQSAVTTGDSEPEPDLAVVREDGQNYLTRHPGSADIALLIEVANSSLARDRDDKGRLFARAGIGCYWIINLIDNQIEVYTDPTGPGANPQYLQRRDYARHAAVPLVVDGQDRGPIHVRDLLP